jgi:PAS domain S-box-containing protein
MIFSNAHVSELLGPDGWTPSTDLDDYRNRFGWHADGRKIEADEWPLARSLTKGEVIENEEVQLGRGDGSRIWVTISSAPVRNEKGKVVAAVVTFLDITARKTAERRAEEEQRRTALTLESMKDAFVLLDENWTFQYINREAENVLDRTREELLGLNIWEEFPEAVASSFFDEFLRARDEQVVAVFEEYLKPIGRRLEVRAWPSADGVGLAVYFQDVTNRK